MDSTILDNGLLPKVRVTSEEIYGNDKDWFKNNIRYRSPLSYFQTTQSDMAQMMNNYRLVNSNLDYNDMKPVCEQLGIQPEAFNDMIIPFNIIYKVVQELMGEEIKRLDTYTPTLITQKAMFHKDMQLRENVKNYVDGIINSTLQMIPEMQQMSDLQEMLNSVESKQEVEQIQEQLKQLQEVIQAKEEEMHTNYPTPIINGFLAEQEILATKLIRAALFKTNFKKIKNDGFYDVICNAIEVVKVDFDNNEPKIHKLNPVYLQFHKSPDIEYIQDGDWAAYTTFHTPYSLVTNFPELTDKELLELHIHTGVKRGNPFSSTLEGFGADKYPPLEIMSSYPFENIIEPTETGYSTGNHNTIWNRERLIPVTHVEWKAYLKVGKLKITNQYGESSIEFVSDDFVVPTKKKNKVKVIENNEEVEKILYTDSFGNSCELQWIYVARKFEGVRISVGTFIRMREVPFQQINIENLLDCKLSYFGKVYGNYNSRNMSLVERMSPYNAMYVLVLNQMITLIARNKGALIPIDMSMIPAEMTIDEVIQYQNLGFQIYNSLKDHEGNNILGNSRPTPAIVNADNSQVMANLINILSWITTEIGMIIGVSPQRLASMASDTAYQDQQALIQSSYITEYYFNSHNEIWKDVMQDWINKYVQYARKMIEEGLTEEISLSYILSDNNVETLKMTDSNTKFADIGLFASLSSNNKEYFDTMKQLSLSLIQNEQMTLVDISDLLRSVNNGESPNEVHKRFQEALAKKQQREDAIQQQQLEAQQKQQEMMLQHEKEMQQRQDDVLYTNHQYKLEEIQLKGNIDKEIAALKSMQFVEEQDVNGDGEIDALEMQRKVYETNEKVNIDKQKIQLEREKMLANQYNDDKRMLHEKQQKDKELQMKEKELKEKLQIERIKARSKPKK